MVHGPSLCCLRLTTRAGGLGLNLQVAGEPGFQAMRRPFVGAWIPSVPEMGSVDRGVQGRRPPSDMDCDQPLKPASSVRAPIWTGAFIEFSEVTFHRPQVLNL